MTDPVSESVRALYEQYPFPAPMASSRPPALEGWCNYTYLYARTMNEWRAPAGRRILDAGCGTGETLWPLVINNPGASLTGWDLSIASLATARQKLDAIDATDVELAPVDLLAPPDVEPFDMIFCTGVLHHTGDPPAALRNLAARLKPDGLMVLMLYATGARADIHRGEQIFSLLGGRDPLPRKVEMARRFLDALPAEHGLRRAVGGSSSLVGEDAHVADTFFHPKAVTYTVPEVFDLLDSADLEFIRFVNDDDFDLARLIGDEQTLRRAAWLSRRQKYHLADLIAQGGDYSFIVRHRAHRPHDPPTLWARIPVLSPVAVRVERIPLVANDRVGVQKMLEVAGFTQARYRLDSKTEAVLAMCDGARTVKDIGDVLGHDAYDLIDALEKHDVLLYKRPGLGGSA